MSAGMIHDYPVTATEIKDTSFLDIDQDLGSGLWESQKVQGSLLKALMLSENIEQILLADMQALALAGDLVSLKNYLIDDGSTLYLVMAAGGVGNQIYQYAIDVTTGLFGTFDLVTGVFTLAAPTLQQVTDAGATTTVGLTVDNGTESIVIKHDQIKIVNALGADAVITSPTLATTTNFEIPNKAGGTETFAMLSDITSGGITKATAAGTDTYTATISGVASYTDGDAYLIRFTNGNTDAATLNINTLGAVTLYRNNDGALIGGDIWSGGEMLCIYNSTLGGFQCIGTSPNSLFAYVVNADSVAITRGQPVYAFGSTGNRMSVKLAYNTTDATSAQTYGLVYSTSIAAGAKGIIIIQGVLSGLSLGGTWADGDPVYLGATAGTITKTKQYAPNHLVYLGVVERANAGNGIMYVRVQNGYELDELHNVSAQTPSNKNGLFYNTSTSLWEARAVAATDIDANVSNTEFGYLDGVTSSIQTQLNNKVTVFASAADGAASSGITSTISISVLIPANTFAVDDVIRINHRVRATGVAGIRETRIYANTTSSLTGAILISTSSFAATILAGNNQRYLAIKNATTNTEVVNATTSLLSDYNNIPSPASVSTLAINWTADQYIIFQVNAANAADSIRATMYSIEKL